MFIGVVFSTHQLLKYSQQKQMDDRLALFAAIVAQSKLSELCYLLSRIFPRIDLRNENERSIGKFPLSLPISIKSGLRTKTVDHGLPPPVHVQYTRTESDRLGYATVRLTGTSIARDLEKKTRHGVDREFKNRTRINSIGTSPSETIRLSLCRFD